MFGITSLQELVMLMVIIGALTASGFWPRIIRGLKELRGDPLPPEQPVNMANGEIDLCYRMLGLAPSASWDEVEKAYRKKAKVHHPDLGGDADTMRALNEAYERLKRSRRR
jgi:hypothetical protein